MNCARVLALLVACMIPTLARCYDRATHQLLSAVAVNQSQLGNPQTLARLGLRRAIDDTRQTFNDSEGISGTLLDLIRDGAEFEDNNIRSMNHFLDPRTGKGLRLDPLAYPSDAVAQSIISFINSFATSSPDYALGASLGIPPNNYSYKNAHDYFFQALTVSSNSGRAGYFGLLFESLGHVIHHIQDMAAPQHTRNDAHLADARIDDLCTPPLPPWLPQSVCGGYFALRLPSLYEQWTAQFSEMDLPLYGYSAVYGPASDGLATFTDPTRFWSYAGKGIAEFTNRNFLSPGTMNQTPPAVGQAYEVSVASLCDGAIPPCGEVNRDQIVVFYPSTVDDQFRSSVVTNPFAASESIFTPDLQTYNPGFQNLHTVNRFTFAYDHVYLLPRAVAYSAGFINYFFRGDMKIEPPDEGVYAIVDHSASGCGTPCGFRKVKLKLTNKTPGIVSGTVTAGGESMGAGTLWAVVKYHLNTCYQPDLSGEYGAPNFTGNSCRSSDESIAVSQPVAVSAVGGPSDGPLASTFYFDDLHPIPINASDVYLQVVFRGKLGQEDDAVAVATVDVSEPNFYALENMTDYIFDPALQQYFPLPYKNYVYPVSVTNVRIAFGDNDARTVSTSIATLDSLDAGHYAQFATLMERGQTLFSEDFDTRNYYPYETLDHVPFDVEEFTTDDTGPYAGQYTRTCPVGAIRGMFRQYDAFFHMEVANHRGDEVGLKMARVRSSNAQSAGSPEALLAKTGVAPNCGAPQTTGFYNFSSMARFTQANGVQWHINF